MPDVQLDDWREQEARNEAEFRDRNETTLNANQSSVDAGPVTFVCECGDATCVAPITLTLLEYESVRRYATRFAIAPNHENPEAEFVVDELALFAVVDKIDAPSRRIVRDSDRRRAREEGTR